MKTSDNHICIHLGVGLIIPVWLRLGLMSVCFCNAQVRWYHVKRPYAGRFFSGRGVNMNRDWESMRKEYLDRISECKELNSLEQLRIELLGKKGSVNALMQEMKNLAVEEKKAFGMAVNNLKQGLEKSFAEKLEQLKKAQLEAQLAKDRIDITLPATSYRHGTLHPLTVIRQEIEDIFVAMGYSVVEGPEVEYDVYNFEKANIPHDHPARDMHFLCRCQKTVKDTDNGHTDACSGSSGQQAAYQGNLPGQGLQT